MEPPVNTKTPESRPSSIPSGILAIQPFGHNRYKPRIGGCALWGGGAGSSSNTMCPGPRPTCTPIFILNHPTVWPHYTNVTDRTGQDRRTGLDMEIGLGPGDFVFDGDPAWAYLEGSRGLRPPLPKNFFHNFLFLHSLSNIGNDTSELHRNCSNRNALF